MPPEKTPVINEATRAYIYRIVVALFAVALAYGLIEKDDVPVWIDVLTAMLGLSSAGLAAKNTSTNPETPKTLSALTSVGNIVVHPKPDGGVLYSLEEVDVNNIQNQKEVVFKVVHSSDLAAEDEDL